MHRLPRLGQSVRRERRQGEAGQGLAEYALILTFIAIACAAALGAFGNAIVSSPGWHLFG